MDGSQSPIPADIRRRRFTASDVQAMLDAGVLKDGEKVELLGGELVEMSPQGPLHSGMSYLVLRWLRLNLDRSIEFAAHSPLRLSSLNEPEPEFFLFPFGLDVNEVRGPDTILVIEVAHSSLKLDLGVKASIYAQHGVQEYWVIDLEGRKTHVHTLSGDAYGSPREVAFDAPLDAPGGAPLVIADLAPKT